MIKHVPKTSYTFLNEKTDMFTLDKNFAAIILKHLGQTVKKDADTRLTGNEVEYNYKTESTEFSTIDKALALIAFKYARDQRETMFDEQIAELEEELSL